MADVKEVKKSLQVEELPFELGGRKRKLQFDLNAFAELENRFGSVNEAMNALQTGGMKSIRVILWAALIHDEAVIDEQTGEPISYNITPYQVGGWIKPHMLPVLSQKLTEAMGVSLPDIREIPGAKEMLDKIGVQIDANGNPVVQTGEGGLPVATVVPTAEEKAQLEAELKNG